MKNNIKAGIVETFMADIKCDAHIVPQYSRACSAIALALAAYGARKGIDDFLKILQKEKEFSFGSVVLTRSQGGNADFLINIITQDNLKKHAFTTIQRAIYAALATAEENGIETIACPMADVAYRCGLCAGETAMAVLSAVDTFPNKKGVVKQFILAAHNMPWSCRGIEEILANEIYRGAKSAQEPTFDLRQWARQNFR